jgi:hypothetical protein
MKDAPSRKNHRGGFRNAKQSAPHHDIVTPFTRRILSSPLLECAAGPRWWCCCDGIAEKDAADEALRYLSIHCE